jgi:hypothetical protein
VSPQAPGSSPRAPRSRRRRVRSPRRASSRFVAGWRRGSTRFRIETSSSGRVASTFPFAKATPRSPVRELPAFAFPGGETRRRRRRGSPRTRRRRSPTFNFLSSGAPFLIKRRGGDSSRGIASVKRIALPTTRRASALLRCRTATVLFPSKTPSSHSWAPGPTRGSPSCQFAAGAEQTNSSQNHYAALAVLGEICRQDTPSKAGACASGGLHDDALLKEIADPTRR